MIDDLQSRRNYRFRPVIMLRVVFYLTVAVNRCIDREYDKCLRCVQYAKLIRMLPLGPRRGKSRINWHKEGFGRDGEFGSALRYDHNFNMLIRNLNLID
jgi:hypothetical protein